MKEPDSTQFRNLQEIKNYLDVSVLCGEVNGRNSYGGYTGFQPFSYTKDQLIILSPSFYDAEKKRQYELSGCSSKEPELIMRKFLAKKHYCNSIYDFYTNILVNKMPQATAMDIFKWNYDRNHYSLIKKDFSELESLLDKGLKKIEGDKKAKKKILTQEVWYKKDSIDACESTYE